MKGNGRNLKLTLGFIVGTTGWIVVAISEMGELGRNRVSGWKR